MSPVRSVTAAIAATLGMLAGGAVLAPAAVSAQGLAFTSFRDGVARVYGVNADGSGVRPLTQTAGAAFEGSPAYSPDGGRLVYTCGNFELCIMNADGSAQARLTVNDWPRELRYDMSPAWSPDGTTIAFVRTVAGKDEIWLVAPDGSGPRKLPVPAGVNGNPSFSSDSRAIAFEHAEDETEEGDELSSSSGSAVKIINVDGSGLRTLTGKGIDASDPAWSPDGTRIAFTRSFDDGETRVFVVQADGSGRKRVTSRSFSASDPAWSPDSTRLAFGSIRPSGASLYHAAATGDRAVRLTAGQSFDLEPAWQPAPGVAPQQAGPAAVAPSIATADARTIGVLLNALAGIVPALGSIDDERADGLLTAARRVEGHARLVATAARALAPASRRARSVRRTVLESMAVLKEIGAATRQWSRAVRRQDRSGARELRGGVLFGLVFGVLLPLSAGSTEAGLSQVAL